MEDTRALTYGEKAVGLTFNPSNDPTVQKLKESFAEIIDLVAAIPTGTDDAEKSAMINEAIRQCQSAQMWTVKVATWGMAK